MGFSSNIPADLALKNGGALFGVFSVASISQETKHEKSSKIGGNSEQIRGNIRAKNPKNTGTFVLQRF